MRHKSIGSGSLLALGTVLLTVAGAAVVVARSRDEPPPPAPPPTPATLSLLDLAERLRPLHRELPAPRPGDWRLGPGKDEQGQSFEAWRNSDPVKARGEESVLYLQVIGTLNAGQTKIVDLAAEFLGLYFGLSVERVEPAVIDDDWPHYAKRDDQLLSTYIMRHVLEPALPDDATAMIGFTAWDLWPGRGWNFVFGQASLQSRVGVWSIHRFGDPSESDATRLQCLRRTLKVATHETGHMFSIEHCIAYACNMCGSNNLAEADRTPLALCPECLPKICEATGVEPRKRFAALEAFCRTHGLRAEAAFYKRCLDALNATSAAGH